MKFGIVDELVYIIGINKSHYEKDKQNRSCITGDNLRTDCRQHLPRWLFVPCTRKSTGGNCKQEFLKQEKGSCIPQRVAEGIIELIPEEVKTWVCKRLGLFYFPTV